MLYCAVRDGCNECIGFGETYWIGRLGVFNAFVTGSPIYTLVTALLIISVAVLVFSQKKLSFSTINLQQESCLAK
jgi:hypothetical protein